MKRDSFSKEDLLRSGHGDLFGDKSPRLPVPQMLMFDRISEVNDTGGAYGKGEIRAELDVDPELWFFKCHFIDDPVMPGCLGLDALWQLVGFYLSWVGHKGKGRALGVDTVKFRGQILPDSKLVTYHVQFKRLMAGRLIMGIGDGTVTVDGREVYTAENLRVGVFSDTSTF